MTRQVMTAKEAAKYLGVGVNTLRKWADHGVIPSWRDPESNYRRFFRPALDEWLKNNGSAA